jgi:hypothetical protein
MINALSETKYEAAGEVAQAVECLPSKHEALSSNHPLPQKNFKKLSKNKIQSWCSLNKTPGARSRGWKPLYTTQPKAKSKTKKVVC